MVAKGASLNLSLLVTCWVILGRINWLPGTSTFPWNGDNNRIDPRTFALAVPSAWNALPLHICIFAPLLPSNVSKSEGASLTPFLKYHPPSGTHCLPYFTLVFFLKVDILYIHFFICVLSFLPTELWTHQWRGIYSLLFAWLLNSTSSGTIPVDLSTLVKML